MRRIKACVQIKSLCPAKNAPPFFRKSKPKNNVGWGLFRKNAGSFFLRVLPVCAAQGFLLRKPKEEPCVFLNEFCIFKKRLSPPPKKALRTNRRQCPPGAFDNCSTRNAPVPHRCISIAHMLLIFCSTFCFQENFHFSPQASAAVNSAGGVCSRLPCEKPAPRLCGAFLGSPVQGELDFRLVSKPKRLRGCIPDRGKCYAAFSATPVRGSHSADCGRISAPLCKGSWIFGLFTSRKD